ncbi:GNAT family N-acetyltransferase, partial [Desertihabitans aurantiacus]|uniref:GNAT family N-acetyltransferase n=1 Tax=Desertihabitans aurantiacus TaxID=2282477 RepID=UPI001E360300
MDPNLPLDHRLGGRFVRLDPLTGADYAELHDAIARPEVFAGGYGGGSAGRPGSVEQFAAFARRYPWASGGRTWVIRIVGGPDDGRVVGTSSLGDVDPANRKVHLGWTAYTPAVWGTAVNPECKLLLLGHAFDSGFERVHIQTDAVNERSRKAVLALGATQEGVLRHHVLRADGSWRDTVVFSILSAEWPDVRRRLVERLRSLDQAPVRL